MITKNKIILIGAPGSGKGTISSQLINNFNLQHISTGDLFREAALQNTVISSKIKELMISGELIPDEITNKLASDAILKSFDNTNGFILDGYPRTIPQAEFLTKVCSIDKVFYLKINTDSLMKRIIGRRMCENCKISYNIYFNKPTIENICNKCSQPLIQRKDDNEQILISRISEYEKKTSPLINYYKLKNILVEINANNSIDEVYNDISKKLKND